MIYKDGCWHFSGKTYATIGEALRTVWPERKSA